MTTGTLMAVVWAVTFLGLGGLAAGQEFLQGEAHGRSSAVAVAATGGQAALR